MKLKSKVFPRSASRLIAVQVLFSKSYNEDATNPLTIDHCLASKIWKVDIYDIEDVDMNELDKKFLLDIVRGVEANEDQINKIIEQFLIKISLQDISDLSLAILKCAIWELYISDEKVDQSVVISQYVALASCFYSNNEVSLINKLLSVITSQMNK